MPVIINGTTGISGVDGSAGTPAFQGSDTNTGIRFGTDIVSLVTGGSDRLYINSSGQIGIGSSSPQTALQLGNYSGNNQIAITSGSASGTGAVYFGDGTGADLYRGYIQYYHVNDSIEIGTAATGRLTIDSSGRVGINTSTFSDARQSLIVAPASGQSSTFLAIKGSSTNANTWLFFGDSDSDNTGGILYEHSTDAMGFRTSAAERARIDSSGRLLVGTSSSRGGFFNNTSGFDHNFQIEGTLSASFVRNEATGNGAFLTFGKTRGSSAGATTAVVSGDELGSISFQGADGSKLTEAARIFVAVDGTPGTNDMPGRLVFSTTADGASSTTERMRITQAGNTFVNYSSSSAIENEVFGVQGTTTLMGRFTNNTNTSGYHGIRTSIGSNGNNTSTYHFSGNTQGVNNWYLWGNGTTTYSSDQRLKKNIESTRDGYLDDIRALRVVKYNWKNHEDGTPKELGLIAQEVEQIFPGLVQDDLSPVSDEDPTIYKQLKGSVLPVILLKALQEAAEKIETLEARLSVLESA